MREIERLKIHEGFSARVYQCSAGRNTIGYGYNLDANPQGLSAATLDKYRNRGITRHEA